MMTHFPNGRMILTLGLAFVAFQVPPSAVYAADCDWELPNGGFFSSAASWSCGAIPGAADRSLFNLSSTYQLIFTQNITNERVRVNNDTVTLNLANRTYTLDSTTNTSLSLGGAVVLPLPPAPIPDGRLTITGGTFNTTSTMIGGGIFGSGQLTISTGGVWHNSAALNIGTGSAGTLVIQNNGDATGVAAVIGGNQNGTATVTGIGSTWALSSSLDVKKGALNINNSAFVSNGAATVGTDASSVATATVGGGIWSCNGPLTIGDFGSGTLTVQTAGLVDSDAASPTIVGDANNSTGNAIINGAGARWQNLILYVGNQGDGAMTVSGGGRVTNSANAYIGFHPLGSGSVNISGADSMWTSTGSLYVGGSSTAAGGPGVLTVASGGKLTGAYSQQLKLWPTGTVNLNGGTIDVGWLTNLGTFNWTSGTVMLQNMQDVVFGVGGPLGLSRILHPDSHLQLATFDSELTIGHVGDASLTLNSNATVSGYSTTIANTGGTSDLTLDGADTDFTMYGGLIVGRGGNGTMNVLNGGEVFNSVDDVTLRCGVMGDLAGSTGTATIEGAGSIWNSSGFNTMSADFVIGDAGHGVLNIRQGAHVVNDYAFGVVGENPGAIGEVLVDGAGSQWLIGRDLYVGDDGTGVLSIVNGGVVTNAGTRIGDGATGVGTVIVDGVDSLWSPLGMTLGSFGNGTLEVRNGGTVDSGDVYMANGEGSTAAATVEDAGSSLIAAGAFGYLIVGGASTATLDILNGGSVASTETFIGDGFMGHGAVLVDGVGSNLTCAEEIALGFANGSVGALTLQNGGVASSVFARIGYDAGSTGTAIVSGAGSAWTISNVLDVGGGAAGTLSIGTGGLVDVANTATVRSTGTLLLAGGTLEATTLNLAGGALRGTGSVTAAVTNAGTVAPGASAGLINVTGAYSQDASGVLAIELGGLAAGSQYDRLAVSGAATLGGIMQVTLINGFVPSGNASFTVVTAGSVSGNFSNVVFTNLPAGAVASVLYGPSSVTINITAAVVAGDMNCDNVVNLNDVGPFMQAMVDPAAYQISHPSCALSRADINADGAANGGDIQYFLNDLLTP